MTLNTSIAPRRDGTVIATGADGAKFVFAADADGLMVCNVTDEALVVQLLNSGNFFPTDEADFQAAMAIARANAPAADDDGPADDDDDLEDIVIGDGTPVEAGTPPAPAGKRRKAAPAA